MDSPQSTLIGYRRYLGILEETHVFPLDKREMNSIMKQQELTVDATADTLRHVRKG
jgi:hypothetical protein